MAHSLASATGTRVDSASKHIVPCRMATDYMISLISVRHADNAGRELQLNKHKYCMAKDDIAIGLGRPLFGSSVHHTKKKAYPNVITTLGQMMPEARKFLALNNFMCRNSATSSRLKKDFLDVFCSDREIPNGQWGHTARNILKLSEDDKKSVRFQIKNMLEFYVVGISLGTAWAHPSSGDTVASVMIGGLRTVLNGGFPIHTNDPICIYFDDERVLFEDDGGRKPRAVIGNYDPNANDDDLKDAAFTNMAKWIKDNTLQNMEQSAVPVDSGDRLRMMYHERENGNYPATNSEGKFVGKIHVARIKPYIVSRHLDANGNPEHFPADKARIFAKAISNAMPYERVDIMISRQSL